MGRLRKLSQTIWHYQYYIVWTPKYRFKILKGKVAEEVDFLLSNNHKPFLLIETKLSDDHAAKSLIKFQKILNIPAVQLVNKSGICKLVSNNNLKIMIISADHWISLLP